MYIPPIRRYHLVVIIQELTINLISKNEFMKLYEAFVSKTELH